MIIRWGAISANTTGTITVKVGNLTRKVTITRKPTLSAVGGVQQIDGTNYVSATIINPGIGNWFALSDDGNTPTAGSIIYSNTNKIYVMTGLNMTQTNGEATNRTNAECYLVRTDDNGGGRIKMIASQAIFTITPPHNTQSYVGAFWRNNQTGERLIRIPYQSGSEGTWTATVIAGQDWIKMDTQTSSDGGVSYTNTAATPADMNLSANDALHQVTDATATGNLAAAGYIAFRIGLKSVNPDPAKPRYGLILLAYNNNNKYYVIFVRQGEEPDYIMRKEDPAGTMPTLPANTGIWTGTGSEYTGANAGIPRPYAAKWSPYNLTSPTGANYNYPATGRTPAADYLTKYPSQGGGFFQFAGGAAGYERMVCPPIGGAGTWAATNAPANGWWDNIKATYETCPDGYHRPNDGITNAYDALSTATNSDDVAISEYRQSLWLNPRTGNQQANEDNILYGRYADGFFDRRTTTSDSYVSTVWTVAYDGALTYNPFTYASVFWPGGNYREMNGSHNYAVHSHAQYYASSMISQDAISALRLAAGMSQMEAAGFYAAVNGRWRYGMLMRCALD
jgi:hypothetical protein